MLQWLLNLLLPNRDYLVNYDKWLKELKEYADTRNDNKNKE